MVFAEEILAAPDLVNGLIVSIDALAGAMKATGLAIFAWLGFSAYRLWVTKKEYKLIKGMDKDLKTIKRKLKV